MAEITKLQLVDYLRSGIYSTPIYAIDITLPESTVELQIRGGIFRVATEYISAGTNEYYGILDEPLGMRKTVNSRLIGSPADSNAILRVRLIGTELPDWIQELVDVNFNSAKMVIKVGWRGLDPANYYVIDTGYSANATISDDGSFLSMTFLRSDSYFNKDHGHLSNSFTAPDGGIGQSMPFGKVGRVPVSVEPVLNVTLSGGTSFIKKGRWKSGQAYLLNDVVVSSNTGRTYKCTAAGTAAGTDKNLTNGSDTGASWSLFFEGWDFYFTWDSAVTPIAVADFHINDDKAWTQMGVSGTDKCSLYALFQGDRWGVATTEEDQDNVAHTKPDMTVEVDVQNSYTGGDFKAVAVLKDAFQYADSDHLPYAGLVDGVGNFQAKNTSEYNSAVSNVCGYPFTATDTDGKPTHFSWKRAMDFIVGGTGGAWTTDRNGLLVLVAFNKSFFWQLIGNAGWLEPSDFVEHTRKDIAEYDTVTINGIKHNQKGIGAFSVSANHVDIAERSGRSSITINTGITSSAEAGTLASEIVSAKWVIHTFTECRVGMAFEAGDKIIFNVKIDEIPANTKGYVISAPVSSGEPLILAIKKP